MMKFYWKLLSKRRMKALILKETMEEAGRALLKIVPAGAEVVVMDSWGEK